MKPILLSILLSLPALVWGQRTTISGRAQDRVTGEPLEFASVGIKGKALGTVTNLRGEFDFHIPSEFRNEILVVSMLGYRNYEAPVWTLAGDSVHTIRMDKAPTILDEVEVRDSLSGGDVLRIALSRIESNFPMQPFVMEGFYRDVKKVGGTYISLLEAAVKIYDEDYKEPRNKFKLRERVRLIEVRKSLGYENRFTRYFDQDNLLEDLLLNNNIRYRQIEARDELFAGISRERDSYYDGHEIYVVSHSKEYKLTVFIDKQDYAIVHLDYETGATDETVDRNKKLISKFGGIKKSIDFKRYKGKLFLNFIEMTSREKWMDVTTGKLEFETELFQQLLINDIQTEVTAPIGTTEKMRNYGLQYQNNPYNKTFWDNYNLIKETPIDQQIRADLEKLAPLEKQFEEN